MDRSAVERLFYGDGEADSSFPRDDLFPGESEDDETHVFKAKKPEWFHDEANYSPVIEKIPANNRKTRKKRRMVAKERKRSRHPALYNLLDWVKVVAVAVALAVFLNCFVIINSKVPSGSMENTIMTGSRMIGFRLSYTFSDPERGDIIIFKFPDDTSVNYVKRVIGLPGETVEIKDGCVYIDGEVLYEEYLDVVTEGDFGPYTVPEGCYFVMGDNRNNSYDSRYWDNTYVPEENIIGKALFCYWPLTNIGILE